MTEQESLMTRPGQPFDHDLYTHIALSDLRVGHEVQADDGWNEIAPWSICTVQGDNGRLYIESKDGSPMFLDSLAPELDPANCDLIWGLFYVPLGEPRETIFALGEDDELLVIKRDRPIQ
jgi:hypothetical protein